jgi:hypothetical protein
MGSSNSEPIALKSGRTFLSGFLLQIKNIAEVEDYATFQSSCYDDEPQNYECGLVMMGWGRWTRSRSDWIKILE